MRAEHRHLLSLLECHAEDPSPSTRESLALIYSSARLHFTAEIGVFYPIIAGLPGGDEILDRAGDEYARVMSLLVSLRDPCLDEPSVRGRVADLYVEVRRHVEFAEAERGPFALSGMADTDWEMLERALAERRLILSQSNGI